MTQYFRITAYHPKHDISAIFDSNGKFEKLWQFSAYLVEKGFKIIAVNKEEQFKDITTTKSAVHENQIILKACGKGQPIIKDKNYNINGITYTETSIV